MSTDVVSERLIAVWPPAEWRDVHVLAAVSGGADSMALLRALLAIKQRIGGAGRVFAGHVNHQLRGEASDADEAWLQGECERLGAPLLLERANTRELAAARGDGLEEAARDARYRLLTAMAERVGARFVAVAHTRDDQVETVLFRLLRGSGFAGLAGMPATRALSGSVALVRPILAFGRAELREFLASLGQAWREDDSNRDARFARNRIRDQLLPLLRSDFNPDVDAAIARLAEMAGEVNDVLGALADRLLAECELGGELALSTAPGGFAISTAPLESKPDVIISEVLRRAWRKEGMPEQAMTNSHWRQLAAFARSAEVGQSLNLPGNLRALRPRAGVLAVQAAGTA